MNATTLIQKLILTESGGNKLEIATNVLNELHNMKQLKEMPFFIVRRAIKIQSKIVEKLKS